MLHLLVLAPLDGSKTRPRLLHSTSRSHACCVPRKSLTNTLVIVSNPRRSGNRPLRPIGGKLIGIFAKSTLSRTPAQQHQSSLIWIRGGLVLNVHFHVGHCKPRWQNVRDDDEYKPEQSETCVSCTCQRHSARRQNVLLHLAVQHCHNCIVFIKRPYSTVWCCVRNDKIWRTLARRRHGKVQIHI